MLGRLPIPSPLTPIEFNEEMGRGVIVVDARTPSAFGGAHIKGSYSIWLEGLPAYAGWVLTYEKPILLVLECSDHLDKAVRYLVRQGYDNIVGYLRCGIEAWYDSGLLSIWGSRVCTASNSGLTVAKRSWDSMLEMRMIGKKGILRVLCISISGNSRVG